MPQHDIIAPREPMDELPAVCSITPADLKEVLAKGWDDFLETRTYIVFLCVIYPIMGLLMARATFGYELIPLLFPLAAGFALIGPFAAIGLYELSRRRELGMDTFWNHVFDVVHSPSLKGIVMLGLLLLMILTIWIAIADAIYVANFGYGEPTSLTAFAHEVFTTPAGLNMIIVGNAVGFLFALLVFAISAVSFPLLLDRNVGVVVAVITSIKVLLRNPVTMALWGLIIAGGLAIGSLPLFLGLVVVMPVLGHATWHLYRKVVVRDPSPRPEYVPRPKAERYGAEFPASIFFPSRKDPP